jgi:hypothetical protein
LGATPIKTRNNACSFALAFFVGAASASPKTEVERLNEQLHEELALDAFARHRANGAANGASLERAGPWLLYGRLGPLRFRRDLEAQSQGLRFNFTGGSPGPGLGGRLNVGIYRRFD